MTSALPANPRRLARKLGQVCVFHFSIVRGNERQPHRLLQEEPEKKSHFLLDFGASRGYGCQNRTHFAGARGPTLWLLS